SVINNYTNKYKYIISPTPTILVMTKVFRIVCCILLDTSKRLPYSFLSPLTVTQTSSMEYGWIASFGTKVLSNFVIFNEVCKDRKSTRLNSSHVSISYAVFCLKKKNIEIKPSTVNL